MSEPSRAPLEPTDGEATHRPVIGLLLALAVAGLMAVGLFTLPRETAHLPSVARQALVEALPKWHITEPVNEIVYGTRGTDTFGETFLLLAAVVSVVVLTRHKEPRQGYIGEEQAAAKEQQEEDPDTGSGGSQQQQARNAEAEEEAEDDSGDDTAGDSGEDSGDGDAEPPPPDSVPLGTPAPDRAIEMSVVVRTASRVAAPVLAVAGAYLVAQGYSPGGGFPAGAVALGVILLVYAGFGYRRIARVVRPGVFEVIEMAGAVAVIAAEVLGLVFSGSFSANWIHLAPQETLRSGGVLQLFSVSEFFEVGTGLTIVVFSLMGMRHDWSPDEGDEDPDGGGDGG